MTTKKILVAIGTFFISGAIILWLWNALCTKLFELPFINYWQSLGIFMLSNLLFKPHFNTDSEEN